MEILQLRYFYESAKNESFAKTAQKYMVSATAVSSSIKRLEEELGCTLFNRNCNSITLSEKGKIMKRSLCTIFEEFDHMVDNLTSSTNDTRIIKILIRSMRGKMTNHIINYKKINPHISFQLFFDFNETDFNKYDIIISEKSDMFSEYEKFVLCKTRIRLRISSDSPLCNKKLTLKQLSNQPFLSSDRNTNMEKIFYNACKRAGFTPNIVFESNDVYCNRKCLYAGIGIAVAREYNDSDQSSRLSFLNVVDFNESEVICVYYKKEGAYGNVEHFLNFLKHISIQNEGLTK